MNDYSFTIFLGIIAALIAYFSRSPSDKRATRKAQRRADELADAKADEAIKAAQSAHDQIVEKSHSDTMRIDRADLEELSKMVDHEYGSD